ncbi:MAG TPA: hypothetical protein VD861_15745 [Pyrinomonadaceae bacterium]|nr:hypothetical protein [Pyrinomonadaceae bacterium]
MNPNSKDRLINSLAGGFLIPAAYFVALVILARLSPSLGYRTAVWLAAPVAWPSYLCEYLFAAPDYDSEPDTFIILPVAEILLLVLAANFVLYSLLTYAVIRWRQRIPRLR